MKSGAAFLVLALVYCASSVVGGPTGGCYYEQEGVTLAIGENYSPVNVGYCQYIGCSKDGLTRLPCGLIAASCKNPTFIGEDFSKPYPECCAKAVCP